MSAFDILSFIENHSCCLQDVVTEIDVASQRTIEATIMGAFPKHGFLGEESVDAGHCASIGNSR
jgi:fructose-1,6-bisphosphatase/inositol monophosphatase family enzyme